MCSRTGTVTHIGSEYMISVITDIRADLDTLGAFDLRLFHSSDVFHA